MTTDTIGKVLSKAPKRKRSGFARGLALPVDKAIDRDGGRFGQGLISGVAVITRSEALGHGLWIDGEFLDVTAEAMNDADRGIKARFTHPSLSSDGMGNYLGRFENARREGDRVVADLHFAEAAHKTPRGDLASYVIGLAEEDPDAFGTSIVFSHDFEAMEAFVVEHGGEGFDKWGDIEGDFKSPDPMNAKNLPHARLKQLHATDVVDEPAANPGGFFHDADAIAVNFDDFFSYALGVTDQRPEASPIGIDADRARGFASRFLSAHKLTLTAINKEHAMSEADKNNETTTETTEVIDEVAEDETTEAEAQADADEPQVEQTEPAVEVTAEEPEPVAASRKTGQDFLDAFGDQGGVWFAQGKDFDEAMKLHVKAQADRIADLESKLAAVPRGEESPVTFTATEDGKPDPAFEKQVAVWERGGLSREEAERKAQGVLDRRANKNK